MAIVIFVAVVVGAVIVAGTLRVVEPNPLAPSRRSWSGELAGCLLIGLVVVTTTISNRANPHYGPLEKGPRCLFGGLSFVFLGTLSLISYYRPTLGAVFAFFSWCAENLPGLGDRSKLLLLGSVFILFGLVGAVVGAGLFG